jgi:hypothetical protein
VKKTVICSLALVLILYSFNNAVYRLAETSLFGALGVCVFVMGACIFIAAVADYSELGRR